MGPSDRCREPGCQLESEALGTLASSTSKSLSLDHEQTCHQNHGKVSDQPGQFSLVEAHSEGQGLASKYQEVDRLRQELQNRLAEVEAQAKELEAEKADLESEKTHKTRKEM